MQWQGCCLLQKELVPWARSVGAGILAYSPMGAGILTGKLDLEQLHPLDMRLRHPAFKAAYAKVSTPQPSCHFMLCGSHDLTYLTAPQSRLLQAKSRSGISPCLCLDLPSGGYFRVN